MYKQTTESITINVVPSFLEEESKPEKNHFVWAYKVRIENNGLQTVQLLKRHWKIMNAIGHTECIDGPGVVGKQPILNPGEAFEYISGTPLNTPSGFMAGSYDMKTKSGSFFKVNIPTFSLDSPFTSSSIH